MGELLSTRHLDVKVLLLSLSFTGGDGDFVLCVYITQRVKWDVSNRRRSVLQQITVSYHGLRGPFRDKYVKAGDALGRGSTVIDRLTASLHCSSSLRMSDFLFICFKSNMATAKRRTWGFKTSQTKKRRLLLIDSLIFCSYWNITLLFQMQFPVKTVVYFENNYSSSEQESGVTFPRMRTVASGSVIKLE